jgi:hypothetical protein
MKTYRVYVRYTGTAFYDVEADTAYEAKRKAREASSSVDNRDWEDTKDFKWSTAAVKETP